MQFSLLRRQLLPRAFSALKPVAWRPWHHIQVAPRLYSQNWNWETIDDLKSWLDTANLEAINSKGYTPLAEAISQNLSLDLIEFLVKSGADVNAQVRVGDKETDGTTPLLLAAEKGSAPLTKLLLKHGADPAIERADGVTALPLASANGWEGVVQQLLQHGVTDQPSLAWGSALHLAAQNGHARTVDSLIAAGSSPLNGLTTDGYTPVFLAAKNGHAGIIRSLLRAGASPHQATKDGRTPIFVAALNGETESLEVLADAGADVNRARNDGCAPITLAAQDGHSSAVQLLIERKANVEASPNHTTPLWLAAFQGRAECVLLLAAAGADIEHRVDEGISPLLVAIENDHVDVIAALLASGANPNRGNATGATPLILACQDDIPEVFATLLAGGADPNYALPGIAPPLLQAAQVGNAVATHQLLAGGADPDFVSNGFRPLTCACVGGVKEILTAVIAAGAPVVNLDKATMNPFLVAQQTGHPDLVEILERDPNEEELRHYHEKQKEALVYQRQAAKKIEELKSRLETLRAWFALTPEQRKAGKGRSGRA